ncbi:hypothetical protein SCA6_020462 [Theobroma cacao]
MAVLERLARIARLWRRMASPKTLTLSRAPSRNLRPRHYLLQGLLGAGVGWHVAGVLLGTTYDDDEEIEFLEQGSLNPKELAGGKLGQSPTISSQMPSAEKEPSDSSQMPFVKKLIASLEATGVRIYGLDAPHQNSSWDNIAGYDKQKREIEDIILLSLKSPEVFTHKPKAVLFEGPPGTGKTSCACVIANQAGVPLLYVPLGIVMSKYYGGNKHLMEQVFSLANQLPDGAIIFLDEVSEANCLLQVDGEIHEATCRVLSVLLRQIDRFEQDKKVVVIAATNRKQDLDPALISNFDAIIGFGLPDEQTRQEIAARYAKHLTESELIGLAQVTQEMSGRDIRYVCQQAEWSWTSKLIRGQATNNEEQLSLPPLEEYIKSAMNRRKALLSVAE